ncbi:MAG: MarR family transcriptional regulator [Candidatus Thorarchaeota archaeon]
MTIEEEKTEIDHLFDDKLRKYEVKLVDLILDIAQSKHVNPKISNISSYLLIHEKLTQKELKELTNFSMGSISTYLSVMTGTGVYLKERIAKTHTYTYSFLGNLEDLTTMGFEIALKSINSLERYFKSKKKELNELIKNSQKGAEHLFRRIDELLMAFKIYKAVFPIITGDSKEQIEKEVDLEDYKLKKIEKSELKQIQFDPEIYSLEDDILNQLAASAMFTSRDPMFVRILGYFITRKYLTQSRLKKITGLSVGKISEEVNSLLESGLIEKASISEKGKITYKAESAGIMLLKFSRSVINRMAKWEDVLHNMKRELEDNKKILKSLYGYKRICRLNNSLLDSLLSYKRVVEILDKILEA